jgi:hypothetical protein
MVWDKEGATQQDYNQDHYACEKDARQSGYFGTGIVGAVNMRNFFQECMVAHGWTLRGQASAQEMPRDTGGAPEGSESGLPHGGSDTKPNASPMH